MYRYVKDHNAIIQIGQPAALSQPSLADGAQVLPDGDNPAIRTTVYPLNGHSTASSNSDSQQLRFNRIAGSPSISAANAAVSEAYKLHALGTVSVGADMPPSD